MKPSVSTPNAGTPILLMAPFRGITYKSWRNAFARHFGGFDRMFAPFVTGVGTEKVSFNKLTDLVPKNAMVSPAVPQIIGTNHKEIIAFAKAVADHGYTEINWNLGCPFARIANKKRGCGILPYPEMLDEILNKTFKDIPIRLSIKTRLGYHQQDEILKALPVFNSYPLHELILHPRTGKMGYRGTADVQAYAICQKHSVHPLIYNGDIYSLTRFKRISRLLPEQNTWMIGRGALINPFLPLQIRGVLLTDQAKRTRLEAFHFELWHQACETQKHEARILGTMKAIWHYMAGVFANGQEAFTKIKRAKTKNAYFDAVDTAFQQNFANDDALESYFMQLTR